MLNEVALKYIILNEQIKGQDVAFVTTAVPMTDQIGEEQLLKKVEDLSGTRLLWRTKSMKASLVGLFCVLGIYSTMRASPTK